MPNENIKLLPFVEEEELKRILDLPNAMRFPTAKDIKFLEERMNCLWPSEIKEFGLLTSVPAIEPKLPLGAVDVVIPIKAPTKPKQGAKKVVVAKKVAKKTAVKPRRVKKTGKKVFKKK
jgi:hypothetical protein